MTIRHLLTHTSGIGYEFSNPIEHRLTEATKKDEWELPLLNDPGDKWHYGPSTAVLGMIVEKLSGELLEAYFQHHIFEPLGMVDTSYAVPLAKQPRVATKHSRINGLLQEQPRNPIPAMPTAPSEVMAASTRPPRITENSCKCCSTEGIWDPLKS
jgi:methyl acetate hydrolase